MSNVRTSAPLSTRIPQAGLEGFTIEDSFIIQGESLNYIVNKGLVHSKCQNKGTLHEIGVGKHLERRSQVDGSPQIARISENVRGC